MPGLGGFSIGVNSVFLRGKVRLDKGREWMRGYQFLLLLLLPLVIFYSTKNLFE